MQSNGTSKNGVDDWIWQAIIEVCRQHISDGRVILFGSRARGDYHSGSDIDLAIDAHALSLEHFLSLKAAIDDLPIVFPLDVVHRQSVSRALEAEIAQEGIVLADWGPGL